MRTRKGYMSILSSLGEKYIEDEDTLNSLRLLQTDLDEKQDVIDSVGVEYDTELEEYEYAPKEINTDSNNSWETKYNELKKQYIDRFFNGSEENKEEKKEDEEEKKEDEEKSVNDLTVDDIIKKEGAENA